MGTDLQRNNTEDSETTCLFAEAVVTRLLWSNRNTAGFSTERLSFFSPSGHHKPDRGETAGERAPVSNTTLFSSILATRAAGGVVVGRR